MSRLGQNLLSCYSELMYQDTFSIYSKLSDVLDCNLLFRFLWDSPTRTRSYDPTTMLEFNQICNVRSLDDQISFPPSILYPSC